METDQEEQRPEGNGQEQNGRGVGHEDEQRSRQRALEVAEQKEEAVFDHRGNVHREVDHLRKAQHPAAGAQEDAEDGHAQHDGVELRAGEQHEHEARALNAQQREHQHADDARLLGVVLPGLFVVVPREARDVAHGLERHRRLRGDRHAGQHGRKHVQHRTDQHRDQVSEKRVDHRHGKDQRNKAQHRDEAGAPQRRIIAREHFKKAGNSLFGRRVFRNAGPRTIVITTKQTHEKRASVMINLSHIIMQPEGKHKRPG